MTGILELNAIAAGVAEAHGLDVAIVCAIVDVESAWRPRAYRHESVYPYLVNPVTGRPHRVPSGKHDQVPDGWTAMEFMGQKTSWGLMQVMGAVIREQRVTSSWSRILDDPELQLQVGCRHLRRCADAYPLEEAVGAYNAGPKGRNGEAARRYRGKVFDAVRRRLSAAAG